MSVTNLTPPVISGQAMQGQVLSTSNGTWDYDLDFLTYAYQWMRCDAAGENCLDIGGATNNTYAISGADVGSRLRSEVTATESASPPPSGDWATMLAAEFPLAAFTPVRTVNVTSVAQLNAAVSDLTAGDEINASNFTYTGTFQLRDKIMADWVEFNFTNVDFVGTGTSDVFVFWNCAKIRCFGADVSQGGYGIRMFDNVDVEFRGTVHDVGATGLHIIPTSSSYPSFKSPLRNIAVIEAWNCGQNYSLDPHAEKGTGLHAAYIGKSGSLELQQCKVAVDTHDQPDCAGGLQMTNMDTCVIACRAIDIGQVAVSQTAGNAVQVFGSNIVNNRIVYIEAENTQGKGFESVVGGSALSSNVVEFGRATNYCLNPHEGNVAWDTNGDIQYEDVEPQDFGP